MPTLKQEKTAKEIIKAIEGKSDVETKEQLLEKVGYSPGIAKSPSRVLESQGFKEVLDRYLPDERLAEKHDQLLDDEKSEIQIKALDLAYKIKGSYAPEKSVTLNLDVHVSDKDKETAEKYERELKDNILGETGTD